MAKETLTKTLSITPALLNRVGAYVNLQRYGPFSQYIQDLIERDLAEREREAARREELKAS